MAHPQSLSRSGVRHVAAIALACAAAVPWQALADTMVGPSSYTASALGAVCSLVGTPTPASTWTCQVPTASGGKATISGVPSTATSEADFTWLGNWVASNLGVNAIAIGTARAAPTAEAPGTVASANSTVAIGADARATTTSSVAIGDRAVANGLTSTAIGYHTEALGEYSIAIGSGARALGNLGYALGNNAQARDRDVAVGSGALGLSTGSERTTAIGFQAGFASVDTNRSVFIGADAGVASSGTRNAYSGFSSGVQSVGNQNVGSGNYAGAAVSGSHNIAHGAGAGALVTGDGNVSIGQQAGTRIVLDADGEPVTLAPSNHSHAVSIGSNSQAVANEAVAVGSRSQATADGAVAVGTAARATAGGGVAIGAGSVAGVGGGIAGYVPPGADAADTAAIAGTTSTTGAASVGDAGSGQYRQVVGVAAGTAASDAVNVSQLTAVANRIGAVAGDVTNVGNQVNAVASQVNEAANRWVTGAQTGAQYTAPVASGNDSTAVGSGARATANGGVAVGTGAVASREAGAAGYVPQSASAGQADAIAATRSTRGAMAVGNAEADEYRQITGVAAGSEDGDAVNVAQLKAVSADVAGQTQTLGARVDSLAGQIHGVERGANAGTAAAMAMAGMPQAFLPGKSMLAASAGSYRGETALAIGVSRLSDNGRWVARLNGSANTRGHFGVAVGAGFHW